MLIVSSRPAPEACCVHALHGIHIPMLSIALDYASLACVHILGWVETPRSDLQVDALMPLLAWQLACPTLPPNFSPLNHHRHRSHHLLVQTNNSAPGSVAQMRRPLPLARLPRTNPCLVVFDVYRFHTTGKLQDSRAWCSDRHA